MRAHNEQKKPTNSRRNSLPKKPDEALQALINVTSNLLRIGERESQALATNDMLSFAVLQNEKEILGNRYQHLSQEFSARIDDFKEASKSLIDRLDSAQRELHEKTKANNSMLFSITNKSRQKTEGTLFTAQQLAQRSPVFFNGNEYIQGQIETTDNASN